MVHVLSHGTTCKALVTIKNSILEATGALRRTSGTGLAEFVAPLAHLTSSVLASGTFVHAGGGIFEGLGRTAGAVACIARARGAGFMTQLANLAIGKTTLGAAAFALILHQHQLARARGA